MHCRVILLRTVGSSAQYNKINQAMWLAVVWHVGRWLQCSLYCIAATALHSNLPIHSAAAG
jgi:hypothetical protein